MKSSIRSGANDRIAYIAIGFYSAVHLALLFFGSTFGNFAIGLLDSWVRITGLGVVPVATLGAMTVFQLTVRSRQFSLIANSALLLTISAWWFALFYAIGAASAAV